MMTLQSKYSDRILNLLVALAISVVVNFSYVLLLIVDQKSDPPHTTHARVVQRGDEGRLSVAPDGHGYLIYNGGDSIYVPQARIRRLGLLNGDRLVVDAECQQRVGVHPDAHPVLCHLRLRNGAEFDYSAIFSRPSAGFEVTVQLLFYWVMSFLMLMILTSTRHNYSVRRFVRACIFCVAIAVAFYFVAPVSDWRNGWFGANFLSKHGMMDFMVLLKCSFVVVVAMLYGRIYVLISQRQAVVVENEQLKNENLTTRYNMLMGQINPHFFFNSLNSLAMLVREKQDEKALVYIDELSYTFRYIIQNGQSMLMTLDEELKFAEAYSYLFKIRYADKLFFDIDVEEKYSSWTLPALSLQPLIGNAVKHNTITRNRPFHISIRTEGEWLVVSNPRIPKLEAEPSTGIGLANLSNRWQLITGQEIQIITTDDEFTVRMPLQKPIIR